MTVKQIPEDLEYMLGAQCYAIISVGSIGFRYGPFTPTEVGEIMQRTVEENLPVFLSVDCTGYPGFDYEFARGFRDMKEEDMDDTQQHPGTPVTQAQIDEALGKDSVTEEKGRELRGLTEEQLNKISTTERLGDELLAHIATLGQSREASLARTKVEEAVMWSSKAVTA